MTFTMVAICALKALGLMVGAFMVVIVVFYILQLIQHRHGDKGLERAVIVLIIAIFWAIITAGLCSGTKP